MLCFIYRPTSHSSASETLHIYACLFSRMNRLLRYAIVVVVVVVTRYQAPCLVNDLQTTIDFLTLS